MIVAYRAPVLNGKTGREEKSPIHVADVMRMRESNFAPVGGSGQPNAVVADGVQTVERKTSGEISGAPLKSSVESLELGEAKRV